MQLAVRLLGALLTLLIAVQAATHAWMSAGVNRYIHNGHTLDARLITESQATGAMPFPEIVGAIVHGINGEMVIPVVTGLLLLASLVIRRRAAIMAAVALAILVWVQIYAGQNAVATPLLGLFHGANAIVLLGLAAVLATGRLTRPAVAGPAAGEPGNRVESVEPVGVAG